MLIKGENQKQSTYEKNLSLHGGNVAMLARRLGIEPRGILDFSSNINPYGPPVGVVKAMQGSLDRINEYPEPNAESFVSAVSGVLGVPEKNIVAGNGSIELIYLIARTIARKKVLLPVPSFTEYELTLKKAGIETGYLNGLTAVDVLGALRERINNAQDIGMVMLGNPNNPCGYIIDKEDLLGLIDRHKNIDWVIDEAFIDFVDDNKKHSLVTDVVNRQNLIVVKSLTKIFSLAGIRLGYAIAPARISKRLLEEKYPWSVNRIAIDAGIASLPESKFIKETAAIISRDARRLYKDILNIEGLVPFEPFANFILIRLDVDLSPAELQLRMMKERIAIRDCTSYTGINDRYIRVAVRKPEENNLLVECIKKALAGLT